MFETFRKQAALKIQAPNKATLPSEEAPHFAVSKGVGTKARRRRRTVLVESRRVNQRLVKVPRGVQTGTLPTRPEGRLATSPG